MTKRSWARPSFVKLFCLTWSLGLAGCVSYEPAILVPAITLSAEEITLLPSSTSESPGIDFGLETNLNESDSLFNIEVLPGVRVRSVAENGPANSAGIQSGDIILSINELLTNHPDSIIAIENQTLSTAQFTFKLRRNTALIEATVIAEPLRINPPPRQLARVDPLYTRAAYRTELVSIGNRSNLAAARVTEIFPKSPLPAAGIEVGDLILALEGQALLSAQDLINRLHRDYGFGESATLSSYDGIATHQSTVELWNPGRRVSKVSLGPLLQYESSLQSASKQISILDFWLFSFYSYSRIEGERSHSLLGLFNFTSDYGELIEELD